MITPVLSGTHIMHSDWCNEPDDFYICLDVFIGEQGEKNSHSFEVFRIEIISPKRLVKKLSDTIEIELGRGCFITSDYSLPRIEGKIEQLLRFCKREIWDDVIHAISRYMIYADE
ncbi:Imm8 family immunity protein [Bacillus cihuensis]|uniref:Imm8 family immunity protein n=1 Tax=Bacillus cihuensis TaxID=1208599 RepID=UPI00042A429C|nr:Imm8 family immunity protein [Bacillus cihuensis]